MFFVAFLPQFLDPARPPVPQMLSLSTVFMAMTFVVFTLSAPRPRSRLEATTAMQKAAPLAPASA